MHPIERLRYVARAAPGDQRMLAYETAQALGSLNMDPTGFVVACRRIVERHPTSGALWWLCANLVTSSNPGREAWALAEHIEMDPTPDLLVNELPDEATVCVIGWTDLVGEALIRRGDINALVIDTNDEGSRLVRRLNRHDIEVEAIAPEGIGSAVCASDLVIIEAAAAGHTSALCAAGSLAAAAVAYCREIPVWLVVGRGRRLPVGLYSAITERVAAAGPAWEQDFELVDLAMVSGVFGPDGLLPPTASALAAECPMAHELLRTSAI